MSPPIELRLKRIRMMPAPDSPEARIMTRAIEIANRPGVHVDVVGIGELVRRAADELKGTL